MARLVEFPLPPVEGAWTLPSGYAHWLMPHWTAFWSLVLTQVRLELGPAKFPPAIYDCAKEDADTPEGHPGDAHDSGDDIDRGYPMISWRRGPIVGPSRNNELTGPPDTMDARYEARIVARAADLEVELGSLIQVYAVDRYVREPLLSELGMIPGLSRSVLTRAESLVWSGRDDSGSRGWKKYHHHHSHTRHDVRADGERLAREFAARERRLLTPGEPTVLTVEERLADLEQRVAALEGRG